MRGIWWSFDCLLVALLMLSWYLVTYILYNTKHPPIPRQCVAVDLPNRQLRRLFSSTSGKTHSQRDTPKKKKTEYDRIK